MTEFLEFDERNTDSIDAQERPWHLLIVDDDPDVHEATSIALSQSTIKRRPFHLSHSYSAKAAMKFLGSNVKVDLILLDVVMETDQAGLNLARWLHTEANLSFQPPVII